MWRSEGAQVRATEHTNRQPCRLHSFYHMQPGWLDLQSRSLPHLGQAAARRRSRCPPLCCRSAPFGTIQEHQKGRVGKENAFDLCFGAPWQPLARQKQLWAFPAPPPPPFTLWSQLVMLGNGAGCGPVRYRCLRGKGAKGLGLCAPRTWEIHVHMCTLLSVPHSSACFAPLGSHCDTH